MRHLIPFLGLIGLISNLHSSDPEMGSPWFTGPLLTPSPHVVTVGHVNFEPYVFYTHSNSRYNNKGNKESVPTTLVWNEVFSLQVGITDRMEFDINPTVFTTTRKGQTYSAMGDTLAVLGFQAYADPKTYFPDVKLSLRVLFPTGKYHRLIPEAYSADATGGGAYTTSFAICLGKTYKLYGSHYLNTRLFFSYAYSFPVHVEGFSIYGGGYGTYGEVSPGNAFFSALGLEYNLTRNWALAIDFTYLNEGKTTFQGDAGFLTPPKDPIQIPSSLGSNASYLWTIAPAIEYNFNTNWGIIVGPVFTIAGKNSADLLSLVGAVNMFY